MAYCGWTQIGGLHFDADGRPGGQQPSSICFGLWLFPVNLENWGARGHPFSTSLTGRQPCYRALRQTMDDLCLDLSKQTLRTQFLPGCPGCGARNQAKSLPKWPNIWHLISYASYASNTLLNGCMLLWKAGTLLCIVCYYDSTDEDNLVIFFSQSMLAPQKCSIGRLENEI
eukprot:285794-Pelagomonas_calceolata.AAC.3